jgi:hypothetical protein
MGEPSTSPDPSPRHEVHHHLLAWVAHVPHGLLIKAREKVKATYAVLEHRYGPHYAKAILGAGLAGLPIPVPFSTAITAAPVLAAAEIHRDLVHAGGVQGVIHGVELTAEEIAALGKHFIQEVLQGFALSGGGSSNLPGVT